MSMVSYCRITTVEQVALLSISIPTSETDLTSLRSSSKFLTRINQGPPLKCENRHSRAYLPRYAVPIFLRIVGQMTPIHNNKQNKVPLREEGIDLRKIRGGDEIMWVPGGG